MDVADQGVDVFRMLAACNAALSDHVIVGTLTAVIGLRIAVGYMHQIRAFLGRL